MAVEGAARAGHVTDFDAWKPRGGTDFPRDDLIGRNAVRVVLAWNRLQVRACEPGISTRVAAGRFDVAKPREHSYVVAQRCQAFERPAESDALTGILWHPLQNIDTIRDIAKNRARRGFQATCRQWFEGTRVSKCLIWQHRIKQRQGQRHPRRAQNRTTMQWLYRSDHHAPTPNVDLRPRDFKMPLPSASPTRKYVSALPNS